MHLNSSTCHCVYTSPVGVRRRGLQEVAAAGAGGAGRGAEALGAGRCHRLVWHPRSLSGYGRFRGYGRCARPRSGHGRLCMRGYGRCAAATAGEMCGYGRCCIGGRMRRPRPARGRREERAGPALYRKAVARASSVRYLVPLGPSGTCWGPPAGLVGPSGTWWGPPGARLGPSGPPGAIVGGSLGPPGA